MIQEATIRAQGSVNAADYERAYRLASKAEGFSRLVVPSVLLVLFVMLVVFPLVRGDWVTASAAGGVLVVVIALLRIAPSRAAKRALSNPLLGAPVSLTISSDGLTNESEYGHIRLPWTVFRQLKRSPDMILLYQTEHTFQIVPRRWFEASDWATVNSILNDHSPPRRRASAREILFVLLLWLVLLAGIAVIGFQSAGYLR